MEEQLAGLLAREEIRDLVTARYSTAVDWLDIKAMKDCFTEDCEVFFGDNSMGGHEFCDFWGEMAANAEMRFHYLNCARIELDGDTARVEARAITAGTIPDPDSPEGALMDHLNGMRYFFDVVKQSGSWRSNKLEITFDWSFAQPHPPGMATGGDFDRGLDTSHRLYKHMKGMDD